MTEQPLPTKEKTVAPGERTRAERYYVPDVDIRETDDALWLYADMPGVANDSVRVDLDGDVLQIEGDVSPRDYEGLAPVYTEYNIGNWVRRFTLGDAQRFDADKISARLVNGVLHVHLPKSERQKARRIPVN
ncbi:MAG TPA: Hsp20/alpha crystallin family protein [Candidatus Limnocylindria bacterium]|nr:Hsp20/alpha crystallin family protein [Candidatus Limnocylindria bacterium]